MELNHNQIVALIWSIHGMGTVFEELLRRFNEENNEEAGEHFTPRDAIRSVSSTNRARASSSHSLI